MTCTKFRYDRPTIIEIRGTRIFSKFWIRSNLSIRYLVGQAPVLAGHVMYILSNGIYVNDYNDIRMSAMASQITDISILCLALCSGADQSIHQSSASLALVRVTGEFPHKEPVTQKMFPFDDVIMNFTIQNKGVPQQTNIDCNITVGKYLLSWAKQNFYHTSKVHPLTPRAW